MSAGSARPDTRYVLVPLIVTLVAIAYLAFLVFRPFILTFVVSASVALLLTPLHRRLSGWLGQRRGIAAGLLVTFVALMLLVPITAVAGILANQAVAFFEAVKPHLQQRALDDILRDGIVSRYPWLNAWLRTDQAGLSHLLSSALSGTAQAANYLIQTTATGLTSAAFELVFFLLMLFFLLRDGTTLRQKVQEISPLSSAQERSMLEHLESTVKGVMAAMIVVPLAQGFVAFFGFLAFGVPSPLLWSVFVVLAALIPVFGSPLGWGPAVVYLAVQGTGLSWLWMLLYGLVVISGIDNVIKPLLLRGAARIHPMLGFIAILGGVLAFGPLGFLIGPVILSLVLSAATIYRADILRTSASS